MNKVAIYGAVEARPVAGKRTYSAPRLSVYGAMKSLTATGSNVTPSEDGSEVQNPNRCDADRKTHSSANC